MKSLMVSLIWSRSNLGFKYWLVKLLIGGCILMNTKDLFYSSNYLVFWYFVGFSVPRSLQELRMLPFSSFPLIRGWMFLYENCFKLSNLRTKFGGFVYDNLQWYLLYSTLSLILGWYLIWGISILINNVLSADCWPMQKPTMVKPKSLF